MRRHNQISLAAARVSFTKCIHQLNFLLPPPSTHNTTFFSSHHPRDFPHFLLFLLYLRNVAVVVVLLWRIVNGESAYMLPATSARRGRVESVIDCLKAFFFLYTFTRAFSLSRLGAWGRLYSSLPPSQALAGWDRLPLPGESQGKRKFV